MSIKTLLRYPVDFPRAIRLVGESVSAVTHTPSITLRLGGESMLIDLGRHLASLAISAAKIQRNVSLVCPRRVLAAIARKKYGCEFLAMPHVTWTDTRDPRTLDTHALESSRSIELCDGPSDQPRAFEMRIGRDVEAGMPVMPYPMHPSVAATVDDSRIAALREQPRTRRVFFAGNQKASYADSGLRREFDVMTRIEVVQKVAEVFSSAIADGSIVLNDSRVAPIATDQWLSQMAASDFFLCPPGASQPLCHNFTEAVAVGTIPILEYGHRIGPRLIDGENAIFFRGPHGLATAIARVLAMTPSQVETLRQGAADFYAHHYRQESFLETLMDSPMHQRQICMPFHSQNLYRERMRMAA